MAKDFGTVIGDVWRDLTVTAWQVMLTTGPERVDVRELVDATLAVYPDVPRPDELRERLEGFVRDMARTTSGRAG